MFWRCSDENRNRLRPNGCWTMSNAVHPSRNYRHHHPRALHQNICCNHANDVPDSIKLFTIITMRRPTKSIRHGIKFQIAKNCISKMHQMLFHNLYIIYIQCCLVLIIRSISNHIICICVADIRKRQIYARCFCNQFDYS